MASAGTVTVDFVAETAKFTSELKQVNSRLKSMEGGFQSLARVARVALAAFSGVALTSFVKSAAQAADELGKTADKVGLSTQALRAFEIAATEAGVSTEQAVKLLTESQKRLGEASLGTGEASKFIKALGLDVKALQQLSPDQLFTTFADAISKLSTTSAHFAAANALFGKSAVQAFSLIQAGAPAIADAAAFVERFGLALDRVSIKQIEAANDSLGRLRIVADAAGQHIAAGLAPFIEELSRRMLDATDSTEGLQVRMEQFGAIALTAFEIIANGARSLQAAFFTLAAGGANVLKNFTFGDVHKAFAASVDANLAKANEALEKIKSIEQIQLSIVAALEGSRQRAAEAVAAQQAAATGATGELIDPAATTGLDIEKFVQAEFEKAQKREELWAQFDAEFEVNRVNSARKLAEEQVRLSEETENIIREQRATTAALAVGLLQALAGRSKAAAIAAIALNKGISIAMAIQNTAVAVTKTLASLPYPANVAAAANVALLGKLQIALIAATGFAEVANVVSAGGAGLGTPANPVFTQPGAVTPTAPGGASAQSAVTVIVHGSIFSSRETADWIIEQIKDAVNDRDVVIINSDSRQGLDLTGG